MYKFGVFENEGYHLAACWTPKFYKLMKKWLSQKLAFIAFEFTLQFPDFQLKPNL